ncbi:MAG: Spy/CpxP family protein refolding chaperone [Rhodoplanes sp.]|uniref:Spy/CpxP family protein refolding chaperone n=1 Tax=Rhodoplanes sp. TaxID=1968906 RepID=UPI0017D3EFAF|nr:Spy/CpxP family protein refolding chaperone [Rhodoplanes sp.]NVO16124.1 Spy/CpxP family protein refolding chaperone [Rhodoplanes sp.]
MWKSLLAGTAVLALAGSGLVLAQQRPDAAPAAPAQTSPAQTAPGRLSDSQAFLEARIAALRAGLGLSSDQEKTWPAFERAYRAFVATRDADREARRNELRAGPDQGQAQRSDDPMDRLQRFADAASRRAGVLKDLADAASPLVRSLDDSQKRRFWTLVRPLTPRFAEVGQDGPGRYGPGGDGPGRDGPPGGPGRDGPPGGPGWHDWHHGPDHPGWGPPRGPRFGSGDGAGRVPEGRVEQPEPRRDGWGRWGWRDGDRTDGFGGGQGSWGPDRGPGGPPWQRDGSRSDDDRRGPGTFGPYGRRNDDRRRSPPTSDAEERL